MYTDYGQNVDEWDFWIKRITGADLARAVIKKHDLRGLFKAPKKWIYPLPPEPSPPEGPNYFRKNFVLVVENMKPLARKKNHKKYRAILYRHYLDAIYTILTETGLSDSANADNAPWCKDGRIAFLDTERHSTWPIKYHSLLEFLSPKMRAYWAKLTGVPYHKSPPK